MLGSICHMTLKLLSNHIFSKKLSKFCHFNMRELWMSFHNATRLCIYYYSLVVYIDFYTWHGKGMSFLDLEPHDRKTYFFLM